jgi:diguanylate cyclase (GGDEF)-like protein
VTGAMDHGIEDISQLFRKDARTGAGNSLAFFEWLLEHAGDQPFSPFTLLSLDVTGLEDLNRTHGYAAGDSALRWVALVLMEEAESEVYRIGPDEFVGVIVEETPKNHKKIVKKVQKRLDKEAGKVHLPSPAANVAMIHYRGLENVSPEDVLGVVYGAFVDLKRQPGLTFKVFEPSAVEPAGEVRWIINDLVRRMVSLGVMLDKSHRLAYTDSLTGLPNMHAARHYLESTVQSLEPADGPFSILLIDGDDLSRYNQVSYISGDKMIHQLGTTLKSNLKPYDFIARWRIGDEFFILLPDVHPEQARAVGERLLHAVQTSSQEWLFPITISVGVAGYPDHGTNANDLLESATSALSLAKSQGKNIVIVAPAE